jgi:hypothetical protein
VAHVGDSRAARSDFVGRPEGKRPLGRPVRRYEDNIKTDLQDVGWRAWTGLFWLGIGTGGGRLGMR